MIRLYHVSKTHPSGVKVLDNAQLSVDQGSWVVILGPGRAGKSTLLKILAGEEKPTSGLVRVGQVNPCELTGRPRRDWLQNLGLLFPDLGLLPDRTILENLTLSLSISRGFQDGLEEDALQGLRRLALEKKAGEYPSRLSQGERRLVAALRAVLHSPKLLLADDPFQGLDKESTDLLWGLFGDLHRKGATLVFSASDWTDQEGFPVQKIRLQEGRIEPSGEAVA